MPTTGSLSSIAWNCLGSQNVQNDKKAAQHVVSKKLNSKLLEPPSIILISKHPDECRTQYLRLQFEVSLDCYISFKRICWKYLSRSNILSNNMPELRIRVHQLQTITGRTTFSKSTDAWMLLADLPTIKFQKSQTSILKVRLDYSSAAKVPLVTLCHQNYQECP